MKRKIQIGYVVIKDDGLPKSKWNLAAVKQLIECRDGETRGAVLRVTTKKVNSYNSTKKCSKIVPIGSECSWYSY